MCERYTWTRQPLSRAEFHLGFQLPSHEARYNISPGQDAPIIRLDEQGEAVFAEHRWGLIPSWVPASASTPGVPRLSSENTRHSPLTSPLMRRQRCLILADGYYDWIRDVGPVRPLRFVMGDPEQPMFFAGLWDVHANNGNPLPTFGLLTTAANDFAGQINARMPVILPPEQWQAWLDPRTPVTELEALFQPYPADDMRSYRVTSQVNNPFFENPSAIEKFATGSDSSTRLFIRHHGPRHGRSLVRYAPPAGGRAATRSPISPRKADAASAVDSFESLRAARESLRQHAYVCVSGNAAFGEEEHWCRLSPTPAEATLVAHA
ncbi:MAG: hypothetical protein JWO89_3602 [Verrucomicrobiaceae bacterium]|nr:hypothetical protein [Verrucomicrobiaceae bacterium]